MRGHSIKRLTRLTTNPSWSGDLRLRLKSGTVVLNQAHEAVVKLSGLLKNRKHSTDSNTLQGFIDRIVDAEQLVALTAIDDAARLGGDPRLIARAKDALADGDARAATNPSKALVFYEKAWKAAKAAVI